jgi:ribonuclease HI
MTGSVADHWWGFEDGVKKMHWRSWEWLSSPKSLGGMGFRDFGLFNQAMLGKQAWRLITNPTSLCARVLKGRYFPNTDFLSAGKPRSASFTWRSILFGRELLKKGIRWGIGDGESVKIMTDNWIPGHQQGTIKPLTPIPSTAKVRYLMNEHGNGWEEDTVRAFFHDELAEEILQVPISRHGGADFVSWPHDRFGQYSVRSAYNLARTESFFCCQNTGGRGASSDFAAEQKCWKELWKISAPGKMKIVLWRMVHDCLPTGHQLVHRHIPADDQCVFCGQVERVEHLFLFCPLAREIWKEIKQHYPLQLRRKELVNAKQWVFDFLKRESKTNATVLAVVVWHIWNARNDLRNNSDQTRIAVVVSKILAYVQMILTHLVPPPAAPKVRGGAVPPRWSPPPEGFTCINVDAALFPQENRMGCGIVLRNHDGDFILSVSEGLAGLPSPEMAEALAARQALVISRDHGVTKAVLVSDCLSLVQRISSKGLDRSPLGSVIADIKTLATDFESCSFKFASRDVNVVAHKLARCSEHLVCNISVGVIPGFIRDELCNDVS